MTSGGAESSQLVGRRCSRLLLCVDRVISTCCDFSPLLLDWVMMADNDDHTNLFLPNVQMIATPWHNYGELKQLYVNIYGDDDEADLNRDDHVVESLIAAKNTLLAWKMRKPDNDHSLEIEATLSFVIASIQDSFNKKILSSVGGRTDESSLPAVYSTAIIRFCHLIRYYRDDPQRKRCCRTKKPPSLEYPIGEHAESLGIPAWITELRNETSHASTPSLNLMRRAMFISMGWLRHNFWADLVRVRDAPDTVHEVTKEFLNDSSPARSAKELLRGFFNDSHVDATKHIVHSMVKSTSPKKETDVHNFQLTDLSKDRGKDIISVLCQRGQVSNIVLHLISLMDSTEPQVKTSSIAWLVEILRGITSTSAFMSDFLHHVLKDIKENTALQLKWIRILHHLALKPSEVTLHLLKYFKLIIPSSDETIEKITLRLKTFLGHDVEIFNIPTDECQTNKLKGTSKQERHGKKRLHSETQNEWGVKTVDDIKQILENSTKLTKALPEMES